MSDTAKVNPRTNVIVGAYTTAPSIFNWDIRSEVEYFEKIFSLHDLDGLEVPYWGEGFCRYNESVLLSRIPSTFSNVVTVIPGIMSRVSEDPTFGLASESEAGRNAALEMIDNARTKIAEIHQFYPNFKCDTVVCCSAPITESDSDSKVQFRRSLQEIASWDWGECQVIVEHCDEYRQNGSHQKGSLSLEDELMVLKDVQARKGVDTRLGMTINWGRSVIEGRDVKTPVEHIRKAKEVGLLRGLMFSGASRDGPYGAWLDSHAPPKEAIHDDTNSKWLLMDRHTMASCISELGDDPIEYTGIKIGAKPDDMSFAERYRLNSESLHQLQVCSAASL